MTNPVTVHLVEWFRELSDRRTWSISAGLAGGVIIPNPLPWGEIESWSSLTRNDPTPWEVKALTAMDTAWRAAYDPKGGKGSSASAAKKHQGLGEYCKGEYLERCLQQLGTKGRARACATCPD